MSEHNNKDPEPDIEDSYALSGTEVYWRDLYDWLLEHGYRLRPRFEPKWVPSWKKTGNPYPALAEDSFVAPFPSLMDAIRVSDDTHVVLKLVQHSTSPEEVEIIQYFSEEPQASDPRNHCIHLLEILVPPNDDEHTILVMPILRPYDSPEFDSIGEGVHFIRQILEGMVFLHEHRVAHRDIRSENLMMDGESLYSERFYCWMPEVKFDFKTPIKPEHTRTECWPRYFIIDFGFSKQYPPGEDPPSELPKLASDPSVPEFDHQHTPANPFPIDVYTIGNLIRMDFMDGNPESSTRKGRKGYEFLRPLVEAMTRKDPKERITMQEALAQFDTIVDKLGIWKLRSRSVPVTAGTRIRDDVFTRTQSVASHWKRKVKYTVQRLPPVPPKNEDK